MAWITVPNEKVTSFTGRPIKTEKLDTDLEIVYKPIKCVDVDCTETFTSLSKCAEHLAEIHDLPNTTQVAAEPELEEATTARLVIGLLLAFNNSNNKSLQAV